MDSSQGHGAGRSTGEHRGRACSVSNVGTGLGQEETSSCLGKLRPRPDRLEGVKQQKSVWAEHTVAG